MNGWLADNRSFSGHIYILHTTYFYFVESSIEQLEESQNLSGTVRKPSDRASCSAKGFLNLYIVFGLDRLKLLKLLFRKF